MVAWTPALMCAGWALLRVLGLDAGYPAVPLLTYTLFVLPVAVLATAVALALRQWPAAALAALATAALLAVIAPRATGAPDSMEGVPVRVMSANVLAGHADAARLADFARDRDVDVLCVEELIPEFARGLDASGIGRLLPQRALSVREAFAAAGSTTTSSIYPAAITARSTRSSSSATTPEPLAYAASYSSCRRSQCGSPARSSRPRAVRSSRK